MSNIPGPKNRFPGDLFFQVQRDPLAFFERHHVDFPDYYRWNTAGQDVWVLSRPDLVQRLLTGHPTEFEKGRALQRSRLLLGDGLLTAEGDAHLLHRRMLQPAFRKQQIGRYAEVMVEETMALAARWRSEEWQEVDLHKGMMDLTLSVVGRTLFGKAFSQDERTRISGSLEVALSNFRITLLPFFQLLTRLPIKRVRDFEAARRGLRGVVEELVADTPEDGGSILSLLEGATLENKLDQALTLLLAGHETTANALTFCLWLLACHPRVRERVAQELHIVLGGRPPRAEDYPNLPVLKSVVEETFRLYPPAWMVGRHNLLDLDWNGVRIKKGSLLLAPQWVLHRDARYFPEPTKFLPERWEQCEARKGSYFPFGGGTRVCIGEGFARMEAVMVVATLVQSMLLEPLEHRPPALTAGITLRPRDGLRIKTRSVCDTGLAAAG